MAISSRASIRGRFRDYSVRKYTSSDVEAPCTRNSEDIVRYLKETLGLTLFIIYTFENIPKACKALGISKSAIEHKIQRKQTTPTKSGWCVEKVGSQGSSNE